MVDQDELDLVPVTEEDKEPLENEDDLEFLGADEISGAAVTGTDWTAETILNQIDKQNILLNPRFQRRDAWTPNRKSTFIESIILGFPIPQIVLAESADHRGRYIVLDGKQRLLSIRQFATHDEDEEFKTLRLSGLSIRTDLNGLSLPDLYSDPKYKEDVAAFENQTIRTTVIKNWPNEQFLFHVFLRLNTNSVGLSPQELRQALHPGPFLDYADTKSFDSNSIRSLLNLKKPDFRMRDVELLLRYLAFKNFLSEYHGSMKSFLDETCKNLNADWDAKIEEIEQQVNELDHAYELCARIFEPNQICRKWVNGKYESRFNRAVFDFLMYYFSIPAVREAALGKEAELEAAYRFLFEADRDFRSSVEQTTKSIDATVYRLAKWVETLNDVLGTELNPPLVENGSILV